MNFYLADHQNKGFPYTQALEAAGWERVMDMSKPIQLAIFDHDIGPKGFKDGLDALHDRHVPVMMYPHSARPMLQWDMYPIWPHTRMCITIAEGHRQVMQAFNYPFPVEPCGWALSELKPFRAPEIHDRPINVLFGPIHPNANGFHHPVNRAMNMIIFTRLLEMKGIKLTVRHIKSLPLNGIWEAPGVKYVLANPNGCTDEIDQADVVIAHQTMAYLTVARGKPLVMMGDDITAHSGNKWENMVWAKHYDDYHELLRYPVEAEAARSSKELMAIIEQRVQRRLRSGLAGASDRAAVRP